MKETRINPETGVHEEKHWYGWDSVKSSEGREERVNPETGVHEEHRWYGWDSVKNSEGREERVNPETGVHEEKRWYGWDSTQNTQGREERSNPETGVHEENRWYGWDSVPNSKGRESRVNPETGIHEENRWYGWDGAEQKPSRGGGRAKPQSYSKGASHASSTSSTHSGVSTQESSGGSPSAFFDDDDYYDDDDSDADQDDFYARSMPDFAGQILGKAELQFRDCQTVLQLRRAYRQALDAMPSHAVNRLEELYRSHGEQTAIRQVQQYLPTVERTPLTDLESECTREFTAAVLSPGSQSPEVTDFESYWIFEMVRMSVEIRKCTPFELTLFREWSPDLPFANALARLRQKELDERNAKREIKKLEPLELAPVGAVSSVLFSYWSTDAAEQAVSRVGDQPVLLGLMSRFGAEPIGVRARARFFEVLDLEYSRKSLFQRVVYVFLRWSMQRRV